MARDDRFVAAAARLPAVPALRVGRLREAVGTELREPALTISVGVACTRDAGFADPRALCRAADEALYAAKGQGRDRVEHHAPAQRADALLAPSASRVG
ncbi:diguanylate cyclase domain-containing protein [Pseudomarimonas salicorniae]|uniref:diguanylate cyclase n=1 Tax=Pseudomarimonas salicorniae TaxID=2933270 RepID=A0ABT0GG71_9GAMM|nr:diguanylate cyclase [Lysobacter sp. CAU 1642]MCK7593546.1 diguanylate cyclase [Lysobacter sp. CAU 1642]